MSPNKGNRRTITSKRSLKWAHFHGKWPSRCSRSDRKNHLLLSCYFYLRHVPLCLGPPNASPDPNQSRGPPTCTSKSSIDPKQLCAVITLYSYLDGAAAVKNSLFAVKHGSAYVLGCAHGRPHCSYIKRPPCRSLYWEGKQRVELVGIISFSQDDFSGQHQKLPFWGFRVAEEEKTSDKIDGWRIDGFQSSAEEKNRRCTSGFS